MTRLEHIAWCKRRAIQELEFSHEPKQGVISIMSDLNKHEETRSETLQALCMAQLLGPLTEAAARKFIDGFN